MKKAFLLLSLISVQADSFSQTTASILKHWYQGWYITLHGDTISGYLYLDNQIANQYGVKYAKDELGYNDLQEFKPGTIKGFKVRDRVYESFDVPVDNAPGHIFLRRLESGSIDLFACYNFPVYMMVHEGASEHPVSGYDEKFHEKFYILRKKDGFQVWLDKLKPFNEGMGLFVYENSELSKKILNKEKSYKKDDIVKIVHEYNTWASTKK